MNKPLSKAIKLDSLDDDFPWTHILERTLLSREWVINCAAKMSTDPVLLALQR